MRIFVLGDSFADNLFKNAYDLEIANYNPDSPYPLSEIANYLISLKNSNIDNPLWWTDWLEEWGYEVINFGLGGCSNQNIFYQFAKIDKEFKEGDRIILHWSDHCRFDWNVDFDGRNISIHPNINTRHFDFMNTSEKTLLRNQIVCRDNSFTKERGYLNTELIPFMNWIVEKHSEYNPIVWSIFLNTKNYLDKSRIISHKSPDFLKKINDKWDWEIRTESGGLFNDGHYGRYGNYYMAVLFDEMIKSGITTNFNDKDNSSIIFNNLINRIKNENVVFTNPSDWLEYFEEKVEPINDFQNWIVKKHKKWLGNV